MRYFKLFLLRCSIQGVERAFGSGKRWPSHPGRHGLCSGHWVVMTLGRRVGETRYSGEWSAASVEIEVFIGLVDLQNSDKTKYI